MSLVPRPTWDPLPDPPGPDEAGAQDFRALAGELMPGVESGVASMAGGLALLDAARAEGDAAAMALGRDWAAGMAEVQAFEANAAADTLAADLDLAGSIDRLVEGAAGDVGRALGS